MALICEWRRQGRKRALLGELGVLDHAGGKLIVITSASKRSSDFADLLACPDRYNQFYGRTDDRVSLDGSNE